MPFCGSLSGVKLIITNFPRNSQLVYINGIILVWFWFLNDDSDDDDDDKIDDSPDHNTQYKGFI